MNTGKGYWEGCPPWGSVADVESGDAVKRRVECEMISDHGQFLGGAWEEAALLRLREYPLSSRRALDKRWREG